MLQNLDFVMDTPLMTSRFVITFGQAVLHTTIKFWWYNMTEANLLNFELFVLSFLTS
jgi:hypothetical protein